MAVIPISMVERRVLVAASVCLAVAGTLGLASWLSYEAPLDALPGDLEGIPEGTRVRMLGEVEEVLALGGDFCLLRLTGDDGNGSPVMLSFPPPDVRPGDRVGVTGRVAMYRGSPEVVVDSRDDLHVLGRSANPRVGLDELMGEPWRFEDVEPVVSIVVSTPPVADGDGDGWWCRAEDASGVSDRRGLLLLGSELSPAHLEVGDELTTRVAVRYDPTTGLVYLEALELL